MHMYVSTYINYINEKYACHILTFITLRILLDTETIHNNPRDFLAPIFLVALDSNSDAHPWVSIGRPMFQVST